MPDTFWAAIDHRVEQLELEVALQPLFFLEAFHPAWGTEGRMERVDWRGFPDPVVGVDEVGRGCLAGPVYAAAVILNRDHKNLSETEPKLQDSKKLTAEKRELLSEVICRDHHWAIAFASVEEIEKYNILGASLLAMKRAVDALKVEKGTVLVDGTFKIPGLGHDFVQLPIIKGDDRATPIAAASIIAKVERDAELARLASKFPGYGFEIHKGYSTKLHQEAIQRLGPTEIHRKSFKGVREFLVSLDGKAEQGSLF